MGETEIYQWAEVMIYIGVGTVAMLALGCVVGAMIKWGGGNGN
jgi:hypothetical protein